MPIKVVRSTTSGLSEKLRSIKPRRVKVGVLDSDVAQYATYVEFGWVQRTTPKQANYLSAVLGSAGRIKPGTALVNPPRPFLGGTFDAEKLKWSKLIARALKGDFDEDKALTAVGYVASEDIQTTIRQGGTSRMQFAKRSPLTMELLKAEAVSKGGKSEKGSASATDKPLQISGALLHAIGFKVY